MHVKKLVLMLAMIMIVALPVSAYDMANPDKLNGDPSIVNSSDEFVSMASEHWDKLYNPDHAKMPGITIQWHHKQIFNSFGSIIHTSIYRKNATVGNEASEVYVFHKSNGRWKIVYRGAFIAGRDGFPTFAQLKNLMPSLDRKTANQLNIPFRD